MTTLETRLYVLFIPYTILSTTANFFFIYGFIRLIFFTQFLNSYLMSEIVLIVALSVYLLFSNIIGILAIFRLQKINEIYFKYYSTFAFLVFITLILCTISISVGVYLKESENYRREISELVFLKTDDFKLGLYQRTLKCCGYENGSDDFSKNNLIKNKIPKSCCGYQELEDKKCTKKLSYKKGCYTVYKDFFYFAKILIYSTNSILIVISLGTITIYYYLVKIAFY